MDEKGQPGGGIERPVRPEHKVFLQLIRLAGIFLHQVEHLLRPSGLTPSQYNVLRILRGAGAEGLACNRIAERMLTRDPDITRLLDRLEARDLVVRSRQTTDRRVIRASVTENGARLLTALDAQVADLHTKQLAHLGQSHLEALSHLLDMAQGAQPAPPGTAGAPSDPTGR